MLDSSFGSFSEDGSEYVLTKPLLDRPWMNTLSNGNWCYVASHLGGGYSFVGNPTVSRITRWHIDGVPRDTNGKFLYVRDEDSGDWWCANGYPPTRELQSWRCHIGLGYNTLVTSESDIEVAQTWFTPMPPAASDDGDAVGDPCLIWKVKVTNNSSRKRRLSLTSYVEIALGNWYEDTSWREFYLLFNRQQYANNVIYTRSEQWVKYIGGWQAANSDANNIPFHKAAFLASSLPVSEYEGERYVFNGSYRDLKDPAAMNGALRNKVVDGRDACHSLRNVIELAPGESADLVLLLGAIDKDESDASELTSKYLSPELADAAFANNQAYWKRALGAPTIKTPDARTDVLINHWFKYQGANLSWWNRNPGYCYFGLYNFGVRDACQDAVSRLPGSPKWVRDHLVKRIMIWQFPEGDYAHGGNFVSMVGTRTFHSDDPINPLFIISKYVRETGDFSVLEEVTPYAHTEGKQSDTIYTHVIKGLEFFFSQFSKRGLPLILKADWNDALDQVGNQRKGDSIMLACWAIYCLEQFYPCMDYMKDDARKADYAQRLAKLKDIVNDIGWDGEWYQRAMHDDGTILGSKDSVETMGGGMIWANPNSFAIVSGVANAERTDKILASFDKHLDHDLGSYTFYPPFAKPQWRAGIISRFAQGNKENGAIFGHSSRWRMWAECFAGRADKAYEIFDKMSPLTAHLKSPEGYVIEPYAACQYICGPESESPGEGSHSWATGTAAWSLIVFWEWIFGVRSEFDNLVIDPCLPSHWEEASMTREWRGATFEINFRKPKGVQKGAVSVTLDGATLPAAQIPLQAAGGHHVVEVTISG